MKPPDGRSLILTNPESTIAVPASQVLTNPGAVSLGETGAPRNPEALHQEASRYTPEAPRNLEPQRVTYQLQHLQNQRQIQWESLADLRTRRKPRCYLFRDRPHWEPVQQWGWTAKLRPQRQNLSAKR